MRLLWITLVAAWAVAALHSQSRPVPKSPLPAPVSDGMLHEHPAIAYDATEPVDPVAQLNHQLTGGAAWTFDPVHGYLRDALAALDLSVESQVLIFSKTALQQGYTSPATPRAFYFDDSVVVGYIPGAPVMEIASLDPRQGAVFYRLAQDVSEPPHFERRSECLTCHISNNTMDVPGFIARSMFAGADGHVYPQLGSALVVQGRLELADDRMCAREALSAACEVLPLSALDGLPEEAERAVVELHDDLNGGRRRHLGRAVLLERERHGCPP